MNKTQKFIEHAQKIHNYAYNYNDTVYTHTDRKVKIECKKHGLFAQIPKDHIRGHGCPKCGRSIGILERTKTLEEFISQANHIHNRKYNYEKSVYLTSHKNICITCSLHGDFWQTPSTTI